MSPATNNEKAVLPPKPQLAAPPNETDKELEKLRSEAAVLREEAAKGRAAQQLFDELQSERNKPHCGQQWREMVDGLSKRAQSMGAWDRKE